MKKICLMAAMLALLLLAGCSTSPAEAGEAEPSSPPPSTSVPADAAEPVQSDIPAYYAAYTEIVQDYQRQYGPECIQQIYSRPDMLNYLMGVCVVRLIDFDLDGTLDSCCAGRRARHPITLIATPYGQARMASQRSKSAKRKFWMVRRVIARSSSW